MIGIRSLAIELPERLVPIYELPEAIELSDRERAEVEMLELFTVAVDDSRDSVDLAVAASRSALEQGGLDPGELDLILYLQGRAPRFLLSSEATLLQGMLGAGRALSFAVTDLGCANVSGAIRIAMDMIGRRGIENVLVAAGSKPATASRYLKGVTFIGDAGMGMVLSRTGSGSILEHRLLTDGKYWDHFRLDYRNAVEQVEIAARPRAKFDLAVDSFRRFSELNAQVLSAHGIERPQGYLMQNLSVRTLKGFEEAMQVRFPESSYQNCRTYGHLGSIDILLNYQRSLDQGDFKLGDLILIMNSSPVACWSSMLVRV